MKPTSALCPSTATGTTCTPSASAAFTAAATALPSAAGVTVQKRWRTPQPTVGSSGSGMPVTLPTHPHRRLTRERLDRHDGVVVGDVRAGFSVVGSRRDEHV